MVSSAPLAMFTTFQPFSVWTLHTEARWPVADTASVATNDGSATGACTRPATKSAFSVYTVVPEPVSRGAAGLPPIRLGREAWLPWSGSWAKKRASTRIVVASPATIRAAASWSAL
ncbi:hypothetical protein [Streptomyces sp. NRRL S-1022]|uniref:hypothetical protein n=1 Tax=Streptomyces sp. NRRL S-1022 TaxID=1463880 RepID=UPI001F3375E1|nr:hypothetical protein [Streptomyces sp. NRRL S-1022]